MRRSNPRHPGEDCFRPWTTALRRVAVQMIVGADDTETWEIAMTESSPRWMPDANAGGTTRIERLMSLRDSFLRNAITVQFDLVPGVAHEGCHPALIGRVKDFLSGAIERERSQAFTMDRPSPDDPPR